MNSHSFGQKILRGIWSSLLGQGAVFALSLLLTPWIIKNLGAGGYGVYTLMWSALSFLSILNLGSLTAAQCFTAQWHLLNDRKPSLAALLRGTLFFMAGAGIFGGSGLFLMRHFIARHFLHGSSPLLALGPSVFGLLALAIPSYFISQFSLTVIWGLKRFSLYNALISLQALLITGGSSLILFAGFRLKAIAALFIFVESLLAFVGLWIVSPALSAPSAAISREDKKDYFSFCAKSAMPLFFVTLLSQGDRAVIGLWLPLTQLGYYALSASLAQKFNSIAASVAATSFPILSELIGKGEEERLRRIYLKSAELSFFALLPLGIFSFVLIPQFMTLWLGPAFSGACTWPFRILVIANVFNLSVYMPNTIAAGKGFPHWIGYVWMEKALIAIPLWAVLIPRWGILGTAIGLLVAEVLVAIPFLMSVHSRTLNLGFIEFFSSSLWRPLTASLGLAVLGFLFHGAIGSWFGFLGFAVLGALLYAGISYLLIDSDAKALLIQEITLKIR